MIGSIACRPISRSRISTKKSWHGPRKAAPIRCVWAGASTRKAPGYQTYDKALDVYYLTIAYAATIRNWGGGDAFAVGRFLFYYRLVGVAAFSAG